jgi:hypothetical protein
MVVPILFVTWLAAGFLYNFDSDQIGRLPRNWELRGDNAGPATYRVAQDTDGNRYLSAVSMGKDLQAGVELTAKPQEFPLLSWRWRVWELPRGSDERAVKTMDSAASVYAVFGSRLFPRILRYVWSASVPAGTSFKHPNSGRVAIIVVNSGSNALGQWRPVTRNLIDDYKSAFGSNPGNLIGIAVKTDSDSTRSSARADYDDFQLERR